METVLEVLKKTEQYFSKAGLENPKVDAEWILSHGLGCKRLELYLQFERPLTEAELGQLRDLVKRRGQREPLQLIQGKVAFHDLEIPIRPGVLIPRPETEELVERVLQRMSHEPTSVIDLGTGSGAIALAIANARPKAKVLAIDLSEDALVQAKDAAKALGLRERISFRRGSWLQGIDSKAEWIISNPPYLTEKEWEACAPEVKQFDPREALVAGDEGLADAKEIILQAGRCLKDNGNLVLECGVDHPESLKPFAESHGFHSIEFWNDIHGRQRFFFGQHSG